MKRETALTQGPKTNEKFLLDDVAQLRAVVKALTVQIGGLIETPGLLKLPDVRNVLKLECTMLHATTCENCGNERDPAIVDDFHRTTLKALFQSLDGTLQLAGEGVGGVVESRVDEAMKREAMDELLSAMEQKMARSSTRLN